MERMLMDCLNDHPIAIEPRFSKEGAYNLVADLYQAENDTWSLEEWEDKLIHIELPKDISRAQFKMIRRCARLTRHLEGDIHSLITLLIRCGARHLTVRAAASYSPGAESIIYEL